MSTYVDIKYLNLMSHRLQRFSKKGDYLWNFRCPFCGDSKSQNQKQEVMSIGQRMICSINVITVQRERTLEI